MVGSSSMSGGACRLREVVKGLVQSQAEAQLPAGREWRRVWDQIQICSKPCSNGTGNLWGIHVEDPFLVNLSFYTTQTIDEKWLNWTFSLQMHFNVFLRDSCCTQIFIILDVQYLCRFQQSHKNWVHLSKMRAVAQWKCAGPITQRSMDWNYPLLVLWTFPCVSMICNRSLNLTLILWHCPNLVKVGCSKNRLFRITQKLPLLLSLALFS